MMPLTIYDFIDEVRENHKMVTFHEEQLIGLWREVGRRSTDKLTANDFELWLRSFCSELDFVCFVDLNPRSYRNMWTIGNRKAYDQYMFVRKANEMEKENVELKGKLKRIKGEFIEFANRFFFNLQLSLFGFFYLIVMVYLVYAFLNIQL